MTNLNHVHVVIINCEVNIPGNKQIIYWCGQYQETYVTGIDMCDQETQVAPSI